MSRLKYILVLSMSILLIGALTSQERLVIDEIVAKVGDELLLKSEIDQALAYHKERLQHQFDGDIECTIIDDLLTSKLLVAQADIDSIVISDEQVETELQRKIDFILRQMDNDVEIFQNYYGKSVTEVRNNFREPLKKQLIAQNMQDHIMAGVRITPSEVLDFYGKIPSDSMPYFNSEVEVGEVVSFPEVNAVERQKALDKARAIRDRIVIDGEALEDLARRYSGDLGSARHGGELGWQQRGTFVPEFEAAAFSLEPGEVSEPVETDFGFHIIKLIERRGNSILTKHILISPEITEADIEIAKNKMDSVALLIKSDSIPFEVAVRLFSDDGIQSYNNGGRITNPNTGKTFFETPELETEIFFGIDTIEVGEITSPIRFEDPRQGVYFRIIKLLSRTKPHQADLSQDYSKIKEAAINQSKQKVIGEWKRDTMRTVFIDLNDKYFQQHADCDIIQAWLKVAD